MPNETQKSPSQRWLTRGVLGIGLSSLLSDMGHEAATSVLPILIAGMGAPAFALGLIEGVADGLSSFAKLAGGWIADRAEWRKPVAAGGYLIVALSTFAYSLAQSWPMLLVCRALGWTGRGAKGPSRDALLADAVAPSQVGRAFGFERAMDTVGAVLGPAIALFLIHRMSVRHALRWTFIPGIFATLAFAALVPAGTRLLRHQPLNFFASLRSLPSQFRNFLAGVFLFGLGDFAPTLLILRAAHVLQPAYGAARAGALAVMLYTGYNIVQALASFPSGALADRFNKRSLLAMGYSIATLMNLGFIFLNMSLAVIGLLFTLAGLFAAVREAVEKASASEILGSENRGTGYGVLAATNGVGDFASSTLVGLLWSAVSPAAGFAYAAALTFAGAFVIFRSRR